jgi:hypothetical protein
MRNLYSAIKGQSAIRDLFAVKHDCAGTLLSMPAIFPDLDGAKGPLSALLRHRLSGTKRLI